jgi:hypothetical protein
MDHSLEQVRAELARTRALLVRLRGWIEQDPRRDGAMATAVIRVERQVACCARRLDDLQWLITGGGRR